MGNERKIKKAETNLADLQLRLLQKGAVDTTFLDFIRGISDAKQRIASWKIVLSRKGLSQNDLYEICAAIDEILQKEAWEKYVKTASSGRLAEIMRYESVCAEMALEELSLRIQKGDIFRGQAREILLRIFEEVPTYRRKIWDIFKYLEPTKEEMQRLIDLFDRVPIDDSQLRDEIQRTARELCQKRLPWWKKRKDESPNVQFISKIRALEQKIATLKGS